MIDGMIGCDAIHMVMGGLAYVGIVTDDDDLLPAALFAHSMNANVLAWIRARRVGSAMNDIILLDHGLRLHEFGHEIMIQNYHGLIKNRIGNDLASFAILEVS